MNKFSRKWFQKRKVHLAVGVTRRNFACRAAAVLISGLLAIAAQAQIPKRTPESGQQRPAIIETSLGRRQPGLIDYTLSVSPDSNHVAYVIKRGDSKCVVVDGREGKLYPDVPEEHLTEHGRAQPISFSPDGNHLAYVARDKRGFFVVVDGAEGPIFDSINTGAAIFSPDSKHLAYVATRACKEIVVFDGVEGKPFDYLAVVPLRFSPDGKRLIYAARRGNKDYVVDGAKEIDEGDYVSPIFYSKDGGRYAYQVSRGEDRRVVVDGVVGKSYVEIGNEVLFSADGKHVMYRAAVARGEVLVVDGVELSKVGAIGENEYDFTPDGRPAYRVQVDPQTYYMEFGDRENGPYNFAVGTAVYSADGKHYAFEARRGNKVLLVIDEKETPEFDETTLVVFSPDGSRVAYAGRFGQKQYLTIDGSTSEYDQIGPVVFSGDSRHVAAAVQKAGHSTILLDGKAVFNLDGLPRRLEFIPGSEGRIAFLTQKGPGWAAVIDGVTQKTFDDIGEIIPFSGGRHLLYGASSGKHDVIVADGMELSQYDDILTTFIKDGPDSLHFIAERNGGFLRVSVQFH